MQKQFEKIMDVGEQMLICGAEVYRVEESVERMCRAIGFVKTDVFIITSSMVVTVCTEQESYTQTRRVKATGMNIERLHRLNALARMICEGGMSVDDIAREMEQIDRTRSMPEWLKGFSYVMIAGAFTLFFGGSPKEALFAALIGLFLYGITYFFERMQVNKIFMRFVGAFAVTQLAYFLMHLGLIPTMDKVIIGNIMLLIPGVALTNASRDLLKGDSLAGTMRMIEVALTALAIAGGYFLLMLLMGGGAA